MTDGFIFGFITWISLIFTWTHLPQFLKRFTINHPILTDFSVMILSFFTITSITKSLAGAVASIVVGLLMEVTLKLMGAGYLPFLYSELQESK